VDLFVDPVYMYGAQYQAAHVASMGPGRQLLEEGHVAKDAVVI
jgi:hypothetical protein